MHKFIFHVIASVCHLLIADEGQFTMEVGNVVGDKMYLMEQFNCHIP